MLGATGIIKNSDKETYLYSGYGTALNGKGEWSFGNDYARNVVIFGVDISSSSHTDNQKNEFSILDEGDTFGISGSFGAPEKNSVLILVKQEQNFAYVFITMVIIVICFSMACQWKENL